jgi:hypothetical protein
MSPNEKFGAIRGNFYHSLMMLTTSNSVFSRIFNDWWLSETSFSWHNGKFKPTTPIEKVIADALGDEFVKCTQRIEDPDCTDKDVELQKICDILNKALDEIAVLLSTGKY